jgi:hypothetical protein
LQQALETNSAVETIRELLMVQRGAVLRRLAGSGRGRVSNLTDSDRLDRER